MFSSQINKILSQNSETKHTFRGTFPADALPKKNELDSSLNHSLIINTCAHNEKNKSCHWVFVFIPKRSPLRNQPLEYFCSSGLPSFLAINVIRQFLVDQNRAIKYMSTPHQSLSSTRCGKFVCVYAFCKAVGFSISKITKLFSRKALEENDAIVDKIFDCIFKHQKGETCLMKRYKKREQA